ncbi:T9SS type A sorting domain-containing protein [Psychroserpens jangbogonensis]|uniref:T9SS type A sorting domain-containing protein n=1 Tax=Psychroserpens jangbogonensis TaxID=1484460 RepID=UPI000A91AB0C|nr:T9SS type A sorting domain-containing protein [Psychroserpens jangbogonensis]
MKTFAISSTKLDASCCQKQVTLFSKILLLFFISISSIQFGYAQCINTDLYPAATVAIPSIGLTTIATNSYTKEYTNLSGAILGESYDFSCVRNGADKYVTITDTSDNVLAHGPSPFTWVSTINGNIRAHWTDNGSCDTTSSNHTTTVGNVCLNPINPSPSCNALNVAVVLDESGSIGASTEAQVEAASLALANALKDTGAQMAFVEFASSADIPTYGGFTNWNTVNQAYINGLENATTGLVAQYGNRNNTTSQYTNWEDALNKVLDLNAIQTADIVLFMTDGNPTAYIRDSDGVILTSQGAAISLSNALDEACEVKEDGSHMFMLGVGTGITASNLAAISGSIVDDGPTNPALTVLTADYGLISEGDLTQCFLDIAQSGCNNDLSLEKTVYAGHNGGVTCDGAKTIPNPNDSKVTYCFTISNDGQQTISNMDFSDLDISIDDTNLLPVFQTSMTSGQSITYYYEHTFTGGQAFPFINTANVSGQTPVGDPLSDSSQAEVTESLCNPTATCNSLADVPIESCTATIPSNYDSGDSEGELTDVFSNVETCGTAGIRHEDSNPGDICNGITITRTYYLTDDGQDITGVTCTRDFIFTVPALTLSGNCLGDPELTGCATPSEIDSAWTTWINGLNAISAAGGCNPITEYSTPIGQLIKPTVCGNSEQVVSISINAKDDCGVTSPIECTFTLGAYVENIVISDCPSDPNLDGCASDTDIDNAWNTWVSGIQAMTANGSCGAINVDINPALNSLVKPTKCGLSEQQISVFISASDLCGQAGTECTFTLGAYSNDLSLSPKPTDVTTLACVNPADEFAAWMLALQNMTASGGCAATVEYSVDLTTLSVDGYCNNSAQVLSVDINAKDDCGETTPVTATFTVPAYSNDLALVGDCPTVNEVDGCSTDAEILAAFNIWKAAVLANFSATGGCNAEVEYSTDVSALQAPTQCGSADQIISVDVNASDDCAKTLAITCSFTVKAFVSTLEATEVADESYASCDYDDAALNVVFQAFLDKFGFTGGCDASGQLASAYSAPGLCSGGTVEVTYNVTDLCENKSETASFTITRSPNLQVDCPAGVNLDSSSTVQEIQDAYDAWKLGFTKTGGCNATDNLGTFPSLPDSSCDTNIELSFNFRAIDRCNPDGVSCSSTFNVEGSESLDAGDDNSDEFCGEQFGLDLFSYLEAGVATNGEWTQINGPFALDLNNASSVDFPDNGAGNFALRYTLQSDLGICASDSMDLAIAFDLPVSAGDDNSDDFCGEQFGLDLFSYLDGGVATNGEWTQINGPFALDLNNASSVDFPDNGAGNFALRYTLQSDLGICASDSMDLAIAFDLPVSAGDDNSDEFCGEQFGLDLFSYLEAGVATNGEWTQINGPFALDLNNASSVDFPDNGAGNFALRYTLQSDLGICASDSMDLAIAFDLPVSAGDDNSDEFCGEQFGLDLFSYLDGGVASNGAWTQINGPFNLNLSNASNVDFPDNGAGNFTLRYTVQSALGVCDEDSMDLAIAFDLPVGAGDDNSDDFCGEQFGIDLFSYLENGVATNGEWSQVSGLVNLDLSNAANVDFPDNGAGNFKLRYTVQSELGVCDDDAMDLDITFDTPPDAGNDNDDLLCGSDKFDVDLFSYLENGIPANGGWTQINGPSQLDLNNASSVDFPDNGAGQFRLRYTIQSALGVCGDDSMDLVVDFDSPVNAGQNGSLTICSDDTIEYDLFSELTGAETGGTWADPNGDPTDGTFQSGELVGVYTYTRESEGIVCDDASATVTVVVNALPEVTASGGELSCSTLSVQLSGSSTTAGVTYSWSGPNGYSSNEQNPSVDAIGSYTLTVTETLTGCSASSTTEVTIDNIKPSADAGADAELTCTTLEVTLTGSGSSTNPDANLSYEWSGPNGYSAITEEITVSEIGTYTLTVTDNDNGCSAMSNAEVTSDTTAPTADAGANAELTCTVFEVTFDGSGSSTNPDADLSYSWSGPNGYSAATENITVDEVGTYTLTVTDNDNGCSAMSSSELTKEVIDLQLSYTDVTCFGLNDGTITVDLVTNGATVTVNGNPYDANMLYVPGTYTVVAYFDGNNDVDCMTSQEIIIVEPVLVDVQVSSTDATCYGLDDGTITIESLSEGAFYTIRLNGIGPDLSGQEYFAPGSYVVEAKLIANELTRMSSNSKKDFSSRSQNPCVDGRLVEIGQPDELSCKIGKSFGGNEIRCNDRVNNSINVLQLGGVGPYTYSWSMDKSGYMGMWEIESGSENQEMTYIPGLSYATFIVEVTDANGCTTTCEITLNSTCTKADYYNNMFGRNGSFDFDLYPNPTSGKLTIKPNRLSDDSATVELFDLIGTRIFSQSFNKIRDKEININLSGLASQVYYLKVITKDGTKIKKVVLDK